MDEEFKPSKKKKTKRDNGDEVPKGFQALEKLTSSDVIRQVKAGLSRIAPLEAEEEPSLPEEPTQ